MCRGSSSYLAEVDSAASTILWSVDAAQARTLLGVAKVSSGAEIAIVRRGNSGLVDKRPDIECASAIFYNANKNQLNHFKPMQV